MTLLRKTQYLKKSVHKYFNQSTLILQNNYITLTNQNHAKSDLAENESKYLDPTKPERQVNYQ